MPIINGLELLLTDVAKWMAMLGGPVIAVVAARAGLKYAQADDPHEAKGSIDMLRKVAIGVGIAVSATWLSGTVLGYFN